MSSLKLDEFGNLDFSSGGLELIEGVDETIQRLKSKLRFFKGEWFLDTRIGIPFYQSVFVKAPNPIALQAIFRRVVRDDPAVVTLDSLGLELDPERKLEVRFSAVILDEDTTTRTVTITEVFIL